MLDVVRGRMQPGSGGDDRTEQHDMGVAIAERAIPMSVQQIGSRHHEIDPPHAEGQTCTGYRHQHGIGRPTLLSDHRRQ